MIKKHVFLSLLSVTLLTLSLGVLSKEDNIASFSVQEYIGTEEVPIVEIDASVAKNRDIHIVVQEFESSERVYGRFLRTKKSGVHRFALDTELKPGKYRVNAYIAPRGKNWDDRVGNNVSHILEVVDEPKYVKKTLFSDSDTITQVRWPKVVKGNEEVTLTVDFAITEPRDLHILLWNQGDNSKAGDLVFSVKEPGNIDLPMANLGGDFAKGKYVWVSYLTEIGNSDSITDKYRITFELVSGKAPD